jgi:hypothetical protein
MKDSVAGKGAPVAEVSGGSHDFFQCLRILNAGAHGGKDQGKRIKLSAIINSIGKKIGDIYDKFCQGENVGFP